MPSQWTNLFGYKEALAEMAAALSTPPVGEIGALVPPQHQFRGDQSALRMRFNEAVAGGPNMEGDSGPIIHTNGHAQDLEHAIDALEAFAAHQEEWKPIEEAPRDGTHIWAFVGEGAQESRPYLVGRCFEVWHEGKTESGYDLGWALFPGYGGVSDAWFAGWRPLPDPPRGDKPEVGL